MKKSKLRKIIPVIMSAALALNPIGGFGTNASVAYAAEGNETVTEVKPEDNGYFWHGNIKDLGDNKIKLETNETNIYDIQTTDWQIFFPIDVSGMTKPTIQVNGTKGNGYCKAYETLNNNSNSSEIWNYYTTDGITADLTSIAANDADKTLFIEYKEINDGLSLYVYDAANYVNSVTNNNEIINIVSGEETEVIIGSYSCVGNPANIPITINEPEDFSHVLLTNLIAENGEIKARFNTTQVAFDETVNLSVKIAGTTFNINVLLKTNSSFVFSEPPSEPTVTNFEAKQSGYYWHGNIKDLGDNKIKLETNETNIYDIQTTDWQIFFPIDVSGMTKPTIQVNGTKGNGYCKAYETLNNNSNSSEIWNYYTTDGITADLTSIAANDADKTLFIEYKEINDGLSLYVYDAANQLQSVTNNNKIINIESGKTSSFEVGTYEYIGNVDIPIKIKPTGPVKNASLTAEDGKLTLSATIDKLSADTRVNLPAKIAGADFTIYLNIKASSGSGEPSGPGNTPETNLVEIQTSANADIKKKAVLVPETTADKDYNKAVVSLECAEDVTFNEYCNLVIVLTINGKDKTFTQKGIGNETGWKGSYDITEADGFSIKEGETYKIEAYTDSWEEHTLSYVYKAGIELSFQENSSGGNNPDDNNPDVTEPVMVEIQTSANADVKKKAILIPETKADKDYNKAVISLECAEDVAFNEYCNLVIVVTINGIEKTFTQKGIGGFENGWKGSYDITKADGFSIKKGETYKIEAYTDSWEEHTLSYVFKASAKLSYTANDENPPIDADAGKIYCSSENNVKLATIMANSIALKDFNSLKIQVQCAPDTSFNPWTAINFIVTINGKKYEKEIKGDDETYTNGALRNCVLDGFNVKKDDTISISAYTYSWNDAADYVFKLSIEDLDSLVKLSDKPSSTTRPIIAYNPGTTASAAPAETKAPEATTEPSAAPATPSPVVSAAPTTVPADATNAPVTSTEAPGTPGNTKAPETNPSGTPGQTNTGNTSGNDKENVKTINANGVKYVVTNNNKNTVEYKQKTKNTANIKVPASIKVKTDGKTITYKVTSIADNAFKNNTKLKTVTISKNIVKIGKNAFKGCKNIKTIKIISKKLTSKNIAKKAFNGIGNKKKVVIKVPKSKYKDYKKLLKNKGLGKKAVIKKY